MCGIAGIVTKQSVGQKIYQSSIEKMVESLYHRGPDSQGTYSFEHCALGNTRLSFLDLKNGKQPILSDNKQSAITFNGEMYGFQEIKNKVKTYPFKTNTDTEIVLALYKKYGNDFITHVAGMFGLAIWDNAAQKLILARDRFGEKPLYYARGKNGEFLFASEIKSLLSTGLITPILNEKAMSHYVKRAYVWPQQSIYKNIYVVPPAHILIFENNEVKLKKYWQLPMNNSSKLSLKEAAEQFKFLFERAVKKQLIADVPVGAFLSGGLDSSTVVAIASQYQKNLKTFSFGFKKGVESELPFAKQIAKKYNTQHFELQDDNVNIADLTWKMQTVYDEPFGDSSNIPTYLICKLAREHTKVVLTGDGADELLGGYLFWGRYLFPEIQEQKTQKSWRDWAMMLLWTMSRWKNKMLKSTKMPTADATNSNLANDYIQKYYYFRCHFTPQEIANLGLPTDDEDINLYHKYNTNSLNDTLYMDVDGYMCGDILVKTDRASMANSLELRSPFLDTDLASFCLSLPARFKVDTAEEKIVLRKAYQHLWTADIRNRNKQGFGSPMANWLKEKEMKGLINNYLQNKNSKIFRYLDFENVQKFVTKNNQQAWTLLNLALWLETHSKQLK